MYGQELIGASDEPEYAAMSGIVGKLAKLTTEENDKGTRFRLRAYKPFSRGGVCPPAPETPSQVSDTHPGT